MKPGYDPFWAELTGYFCSTKIVAFGGLFVNEPSNGFDHIFLNKCIISMLEPLHLVP